MDELAALDRRPGRPGAAPRRGDARLHLGHHRRAEGRPAHARNVLASTRGVVKAWRWSADDVLVHALPLSHQHGLSGVHLSLLCGSRAVVFSRFDPGGLHRAIREHRRDRAVRGPRDVRAPRTAWDGIGGADLSSLRLAVSGSAPLPAALAERVAEWLGQPPLERYGSTEAGLDVSNLYDGPRRPGRVGWALPGIEVRLDGEDGEILVRGPQVFDGYWRRPTPRRRR